MPLSAEVLDDDVLVHPFRDKTVTADGDRRRVVLLVGRLANDAGREVIDAPARQRLELVAVDPSFPAREVTDVLIEEPLGPLCLDVAVLVGIEERAAVEDDELSVARHRVALCPLTGKG